jgi:hypothetical protein
MLSCSLIPGLSYVVPWLDDVDSTIIDLYDYFGFSTKKDLVIVCDTPMRVLFAGSIDDIDVGSPDRFFVLNDVRFYRFTINVDSRYLGIIPVTPPTISITMAVS